MQTKHNEHGNNQEKSAANELELVLTFRKRFVSRAMGNETYMGMA